MDREVDINLKGTGMRAQEKGSRSYACVVIAHTTLDWIWTLD